MRDPSLASMSAELLDQFRAALLANVEALYLDARLLMEHGRHARAVSLAILAHEELAKLLPVWVVRLGIAPEDAGSLDLHDHQIKLLLTRFVEVLSRALMLGHDGDALKASLAGVLTEAKKDGGERMLREIRRINALKQYGLYVAWTMTEPRKPSAPDRLFSEKDSRAFVNILINHMMFAYPADAVVTMIAGGLSGADPSPEDLERLAEAIAPHLERIKSYLRPTKPAASDLSTPPV